MVFIAEILEKPGHSQANRKQSSAGQEGSGKKRRSLKTWLSLKMLKQSLQKR